MIRLTAVIELEGQGPRALTHESNAKAMTIGRDPEADFHIPLTTVSRRHASIRISDNVYYIEDLGSTHGTMLNGKKLNKGERKVLRDADVIELTKAKITCNIETAKVVEINPGEGTQIIAERAAQALLAGLGEPVGDSIYFNILNGPEAGRRLPLTGGRGEWVLGRSKDCELALNDPNVSRRHAIVKRDWQSGYMIHDLGSKNGVIINDRKINGVRRLRDKDEVVIGPVKLVFIDPDADLHDVIRDLTGIGEEDELDGFDEMDDAQSHIGAPGDDPDAEGSGDDAAPGSEIDNAPPGDDDLDAEDDALEDAQPEDAYAELDPTLLKGENSPKIVEWLIIGGVILVVAVASIALIAFLG